MATLAALIAALAVPLGLPATPARGAQHAPSLSEAATTPGLGDRSPNPGAAPTGDSIIYQPLEGATVLGTGNGLTSPDGRYRLIVQSDGNLVEYGDRGQVLFASGTAGHPGAFLALQADGNLVMYSGPVPLWFTSTAAPAGSLLALQDDANLVLYSPDGAVWSNGAVDDTVWSGSGLRAGESISSTGRGATLVMQADGNLVAYLPAGPAWSTGTAGNPGAFLAVQRDGNAVLYAADGRVLWTTGTHHSEPVALTVTDAGRVVLRTASGVTLWPVAQVPQRGSGRFAAADFPPGTVPTGSGRVVRYSVEVEGGISIDPVEFSGTVSRILLDARGWQSLDGVRFEPVTPAQLAAGARVDVRVSLTTPATVDALCAPLNTAGWLSCWNGSRAVINGRRWLDGAATYGSDLVNYRTYLISHEVGHGLGHRHVSCPGAGQPAPVMVQQTITLGGCRPWPWPQRP